MSEVKESMIKEIPGEALSWSKVWIRVITRPSTKTFERILRDPQANPGRAYLWIFLGAFLGTVIRSLFSLLGFYAGLEERWSVGLAVVLSLMVVINAWITQWIAGRFLGGRGAYTSLLYAFAACFAPIYLIGSLISGIPYIQYLIIPLQIYYLALTIIAIKAVNQFGWGQTVVSFLAATIAQVILLALATWCLFSILGQAFV